MKTNSEEEAFILHMVRLNRKMPRIEITKRWKIGRLEMNWNWRSRNNLWGRFGGGWQWELGFVAGGNTLILNLLTSSLRFHWGKTRGQAE